MLDEFTFVLADFTSCKFTKGEYSILVERNSHINERTAHFPCKKKDLKKKKFKKKIN
jgi:hypothetical protein